MTEITHREAATCLAMLRQAINEYKMENKEFKRQLYMFMKDKPTREEFNSCDISVGGGASAEKVAGWIKRIVEVSE